MSDAAVGRAIGLSRPAVRERIDAMERCGVIQGYRAAIAERSGLVHALLFVQIAERPCDKTLRWLMSLDGVTSAVSLAGEIDAVVSVTVPSMVDLTALNDRVAASPLLSTATSHVVLRRYSGATKDS